jgi:hypothetical protein
MVDSGLLEEPGSSVRIVSDYGLDDRAIGVRSPAGAKHFPSNLCVQTDAEAHPASYPMGTGGLSPGVKRGRGVKLVTHTHLVSWSGMSRSYTSSPPYRPHGGRVMSQSSLKYSLIMKKKFVWSNIKKKINFAVVLTTKEFVAILFQ